jgi:hypothetical protein
MGYRALLAIFSSLAILPLSAQTPAACLGKLVPLKPPTVFCQQAAPVCVTDSTGFNGQWIWGCPVSVSTPNPTPGPGINSTIPLGVKSPQIDNPLDLMLKAEQIRQMRQQTELMRQQTQALRQSNQTPGTPMVGSNTPYFPLATAYSTMPSPTGRKKIDESNWKHWLKQNPSVRALVPAWSPKAYEQVRVMAAQQVINGR